MTLHDWPIRRKLTAILLLISGLVLLLTSAAFVTYQFVSLRQATLKNLTTLGRVIAANSTASLAFSNEADAKENLSALRAEPHVTAAALYDRDGHLFATYPADLPRDGLLPSPSGVSGYHFDRAHLAGFEPVVQAGNARLGTLYLESDLTAVYDTFRLSGVIASVVMSLSLLAAYVLATILQGRISQPILALAEAAAVVSERQDYSVRAPKLGKDELGALTDAFNHMLGRIEDQDRVVRESKDRLDLALRASGMGTWTWNIRDNAIAWDDFTHPLFGLDAGTFSGRYEDFLALVHPDERESVARTMADCVAQGTQCEMEYRVVRPNGTEGVLATRGKLYRDLDGIAHRMAGVCWDVTERWQAEELRRQLAAIIESADDAIISNGTDGTIRSWNPGAERLFGYAAAEIIGRPLRQLIPVERWDENLGIAARLKGGERVHHVESVWRDKGGRRIPVSLTSSLIPDGNGRVFGGSQILRDITEQKEAEKRLRNLVTELERSNQELEQFAYVASHDLQEPLRMVSSYTQLLERRYRTQLDDDAREFIGFAVDGATRMQALINALLDFSRVSTRGKPPEPVDLNELLGAVRFALTTAVQDTGALVTNDELPTVVADGLQIGQVLQNLIGNALKFHGTETPRVHLTAIETPTETQVSVCDNGIGIAPEYFERVFGMFQRLHTKNDYPGTGIGLAICRRVVERHGGRIWIESEPGRGTTAHFTLPKRTGEQAS